MRKFAAQKVYIHMKRPDIIERIQHAVMPSEPKFTLWLYGSEARGDARPDSDIDLLVLVDAESVSLREQMAINAPLFDIELDTGIQINTHIEPRATWEARKSVFTHNVNKERIAL